MVKAKIAVKSKILFMIVILNTNYGLQTWKINGSFFFGESGYYDILVNAELKLNYRVQQKSAVCCMRIWCMCLPTHTKQIFTIHRNVTLSSKKKRLCLQMNVCMCGCVRLRLMSVRPSIGCHRNMIH